MGKSAVNFGPLRRSRQSFIAGLDPLRLAVLILDQPHWNARPESVTSETPRSAPDFASSVSTTNRRCAGPPHLSGNVRSRCRRSSSADPTLPRLPDRLRPQLARTDC